MTALLRGHKFPFRVLPSNSPLWSGEDFADSEFLLIVSDNAGFGQRASTAFTPKRHALPDSHAAVNSLGVFGIGLETQQA